MSMEQEGFVCRVLPSCYHVTSLMGQTKHYFLQRIGFSIC